MKDVTVKAQLIRRAMLCCAKNDVRYYLKGVFLGANGDVVATNGHTLFKGHSDQAPEEDIILSINGVFPAKAETIRFEFSGIDHDGIRGNAFDNLGNVRSFEEIAGRFPDYDRVIPKYDESFKNITGVIGINSSYLALVEKVFGKDTVIEFQHGDSNKAMTITSKNDPDQVLVIMPCRIK